MVKQYMDNSIFRGRDNEYVETILGRRRYLTDINSRNSMMRKLFGTRNVLISYSGFCQILLRKQ